jgi:SNF2 family DNA or RNA helicase
MNDMKAGMDKSSRSFLKSKQGQRISYERSLRPSAATLVVVPLALLEHWYEQILRHIGLHYFTRMTIEEENLYTHDMNMLTGFDDEQKSIMKEALTKHGVVYLDGLGDLADVQTPLSKLQVTSSMQISNTELAHYIIVITTFERCQQQFQNALHITNGGIRGDNPDGFEYNRHLTSRQLPLLQIRWSRLVVDEGHELGLVDKRDSSVTLFLSEIAAERRWVMSGTPTAAVSTRMGLLQLHRLLRFLRHETYGIDADGLKYWKLDILEGFTHHNMESYQLLVDVLKGVMVRHLKVQHMTFNMLYSLLIVMVSL